EVSASAIGVVTETGRLRVVVGDEVVGDLPVTALVDECPAYDLAPAAPSVPLYEAPPRVLADDAAPEEALRALAGSRTARRPEQADAAVLMLADEGAPRPALAVAIDGNGRRVAIDPYRG